MSRNWRHFNSFASRAKDSYSKWRNGLEPPLPMNERLRYYATDAAIVAADVVILYGKEYSLLSTVVEIRKPASFCAPFLVISKFSVYFV